MCTEHHNKLTKVILLAALFIPCTLLFAAPPTEPQVRILVQKTKGSAAQAASSAIAGHGAAIHAQIPQLGVYVLSVPQSAANGLMHSLTNTGLFTFAEPDGAARGGSVPNDPYFTSQWHLGAVNAVAAWDISVGQSSVPIAMIDSGVNPSHPDLQSRLIPGWSFLTSSSNTSDVLGHGTATAGTAGAAGNNGIGVAGLSWANPIMPLVVLSSSDYATYSDIASAITYAADHGVRVINVSIGGSTASSTLQSAVNYAWGKGAVVFASAMNNGGSAPYYPAACDNVVAVSATEPGDTLAGFSNYGSWIDLAAPGDNILTTDNGGGYSTWYGTSFSSPIAAAAAALVLSVNPALSAQGLVDVLEKNADDIGAPGFDQYFGWGRVNAYRSVVAALSSVSSDTIAPSVAIFTPAAGGTVSGTVSVTGSATDNIGVARAELWIDGQFNSSCSSATFNCSWNSAGSVAGTHTITVNAYDAAGNVGSASESLSVAAIAPKVADTQAPAIQIASPLNGSTLNGSVTTVSVSASDNVGVAQVSIYIDGVQKASLTSAPYTYSWNIKKSSSGAHTITAKAWDAAGNASTATSTVTVR